MGEEDGQAAEAEEVLRQEEGQQNIRLHHWRI